MSDPRTYDYSQPTRTCDVVMKGGITSGVVYPHALCELARTYRFVNVGGTSAGAIAAAAAAAAEHGREAGGFAKLAELPAWVGAGDNLFRLFQPQPGTRRFYALFTAGMGRTGLGKWLRLGAAALKGFPLTAVAGLAPGVALVVVAVLAGSGLLQVCAIVAGVVLALIGLVLALLVRLGTGLPRAVGANDFGLCSGLPDGGGGGARAHAVARRPDRRPRGEGGRRPADVRRPAGEGDRPDGDDDERHAPPTPPVAVDAPRPLLRPRAAAPPLPGADRRVDGRPSAAGRRGPGGRAAGEAARRARAAPALPRAGGPPRGRRGAHEPQLPRADQRRAAPRPRHDPPRDPARGRGRRGRRDPARAARRGGLLVLGRRDREQLPGALLRHPAPDAADVRDRPGRLPSGPRPPTRRGGQRLPPVDERGRPPRDVAPARTGAGAREPHRVRQRDRAHDAEPRRLGAHPPAGLPRPDRPRAHGPGRGRHEPDHARRM